MSKIDFKEERIPRIQKILDHARATINLFNNIPIKVKKDFRHPFFYIVFQSIDRKGNTRELSYNCFSEEEQNKTAHKLAEHFNLEIEEMTD
jgi:hypothetical protein